MKKTSLMLIILASIFIIPIYPQQHIPPCHEDHHISGGGEGACWGYAVGRAFNRTWNDERCPIHTLDFNNVPEDYFSDNSYNIYEIQVGDIIAWGDNGSVHVAYVTAKYYPAPPGVYLADRSGAGEPERTNLILRDLISERGTPSGYFRKKKLWSITVENDVEGNHNIGKVGIYGGGYNSDQFESGFTADNLNWETNMIIDAVFDGTFYDGYVRKFHHWEKSGITISELKNYNSQITDYTYSITYDAVFKKEFNIIFQNNFVSVVNGGVIKVSSIQFNSPTSIFYIQEDNTISGTALNQTINYIGYTFDHWSDEGGTLNPYTFHPETHMTYTAHFQGRPSNSVINFGWDFSLDHPIKFHWTDNPNMAITQYKIWRKVKHNGVVGDPELIATVNRGVQTYTDHSYNFTNGYTDDLLWYDVRQYYSIEQTYSVENWHPVYGEETYKGIVQSITNSEEDITYYTVDFFPNPFNLTTTISYQIPVDGMVSIKLYDLLGRELNTLVNKFQLAGKYEINYNASNLPSGIYLCVLKSCDKSTVKKLLLLR